MDSSRAASSCPVDLAHLDRYTGGTRALNEEILRLFDTQCSEILSRLDALLGSASTPDPKMWRDNVHTLKGAARGVGAFALAESAAQAEKVEASDKMAALATIQELKARSAAVHQFVQAFVAG